jgi:hypothetical protein
MRGSTKRQCERALAEPRQVVWPHHPVLQHI